MRRVLVALALAGCASGSPPPVDTGVPSVLPSLTLDPGELPAGATPTPVEGVVFSPRDFVPALRLSVPPGWVSEHRGDDAFDLVRDGVRVALITPPDPTADEALANLGSRVGGNDVTRQVGGITAHGLQVDGGSGVLLESPAGTVTVPRAPQVTVLALDLDDVPLLVVVVGPLSREVDELLNGVRPG